MAHSAAIRSSPELVRPNMGISSDDDGPHTVVRSSSRRRRKSIDRPPYMSDLRIVLLGKNVSENSRVGNFLLGRAAFDSEASPDVVERVGGRLKDRHVMVINSPRLLQTNISDHQITQTVRECMYLSDPGPHVIVLLLKHEQCSAEDQECVQKVLDSFSERVYQHTMALTTQEPNETNDILQKIIQKCSNRHFSLQRSSSPDDLLQAFDNIVQMNDGRHLDCAEAAQYFTIKQQATERLSERVKLNLVMCGSNRTLKSSISELILQQTDRRSDMELHGRQISLVELPSLSRLSEEEVMCQTLRCVSLCDPGVHVFLLIVPDAPLTDEDKAEMEEIQKMFSTSINTHFIILIIKENSMTSQINLVPSLSTETSIQTFGGRCFVLENSSQVSDLLQNVENMVQENNGRYYTTFMCLQAVKENLRISIMKTQSGLTHSDDDLRVVLLGKTGAGKSATGNTILRREAFKSLLTSHSVTRESQKETSEFSRRQITVIDTPGLFDTEVDNAETRKEIVKCVSMAAPGPHVFLLVIQLGRFTKEEKDAVKMIQETFGEKSRMYTMVLFTRGDELKGTRVEDYIEGNGSLKNLIQQCGHRYHVFNNNETKDQTQVSELLEKIDRMLAVNGGNFYTNEMFQKVEKDIKEEQERIMNEKEEEIKRKEEELRAKYEAEMDQMKKEKERESQEMQNELRKREDEFKNREEEIKKETDENLQKDLQRKLEEQQKQFEEENKRKEKALGEQQQNFIKYLEEKHEKEKLNIQERIQRETREQAEREYLIKLEEKVANALKEAEEKHEIEKARVLQEAQEKYETEKANILKEAEEKYETEKANILKDAEEKYETEKAKVLQEAEEKQETEKDKALQEAEENHKREKDEALKKAEEKHKNEKDEALKKAEENHKREKDKALQEAEQKLVREKADAAAKALQEAEEKLSCSAKLARDWNQHIPVIGGTAGGLVGSVQDLYGKKK